MGFSVASGQEAAGHAPSVSRMCSGDFLGKVAGGCGGSCGVCSYGGVEGIPEVGGGALGKWGFLSIFQSAFPRTWMGLPAPSRSP